MAPSIEDRFPTSASSAPPTAEQIGLSHSLRAAVVKLAEQIDATVPASRDKDIALTHLEDVLMRANRAVFNAPRPEQPKRPAADTTTCCIGLAGCRCKVRRGAEQ